MRIWHTALIEALPREQLVAQWRELSAIAGAIKKKGTPNHILVNFVLHYPWSDFISYAHYLRCEMSARGYRTTDAVMEKIRSVAEEQDYEILNFEDVYKEKMDYTYFYICYWNLYEKMLCGGISREDWLKIEKVKTNMEVQKAHKLIEEFNKNLITEEEKIICDKARKLFNKKESDI